MFEGADMNAGVDEGDTEIVFVRNSKDRCPPSKYFSIRNLFQQFTVML